MRHLTTETVAIEREERGRHLFLNLEQLEKLNSLKELGLYDQDKIIRAII